MRLLFLPHKIMMTTNYKISYFSFNFDRNSPILFLRARCYSRAMYTQNVQECSYDFQKYVKNEDYHPLLKQWILPIRKPPLYIITPTWPRPVQIPELTRLGYVLKVSIADFPTDKLTRKLCRFSTYCFICPNILIFSKTN